MCDLAPGEVRSCFTRSRRCAVRAALTVLLAIQVPRLNSRVSSRHTLRTPPVRRIGQAHGPGSQPRAGQTAGRWGRASRAALGPERLRIFADPPASVSASVSARAYAEMLSREGERPAPCVCNNFLSLWTGPGPGQQITRCFSTSEAQASGRARGTEPKGRALSWTRGRWRRRWGSGVGTRPANQVPVPVPIGALAPSPVGGAQEAAMGDALLTDVSLSLPYSPYDAVFKKHIIIFRKTQQVRLSVFSGCRASVRPARPGTAPSVAARGERSLHSDRGPPHPCEWHRRAPGPR